MKGIILAGGKGTRLYPITKGINKHLIPIYDKPMIYYPLSILMLAGIKDILVITTPKDIDSFKRLLGDGSDWGIKISYEIQPNPDGLAQAFVIGEKFIDNDSVCLILGDNIFYGEALGDIFKEVIKGLNGATVIGYRVANPKEFGVVDLDSDYNVLSIEEKPKEPKSDVVVTGLYFYNNDVVEIAKNVKPSDRGELEITSINEEYLKRGRLKAKMLGRGYAWLDMGTHESMMEASQFVEIIEKRQGYKVACLEEIAWREGWINDTDMEKKAEELSKNSYGEYLKRLLKK